MIIKDIKNEIYDLSLNNKVERKNKKTMIIICFIIFGLLISWRNKNIKFDEEIKILNKIDKYTTW